MSFFDTLSPFEKATRGVLHERCLTQASMFHLLHLLLKIEERPVIFREIYFYDPKIRKLIKIAPQTVGSPPNSHSNVYLQLHFSFKFIQTSNRVISIKHSTIHKLSLLLQCFFSRKYLKYTQ